VILSFTVAGPRPLPAAGAPVTVTVRVAYARTCTFLRQHSAFSSLYPLETVPCSSGRASVVVPAIPNTYNTPLRLTYAVRAAGAGTVQRSVRVPQQASTPPPTLAPTPPAVNPSPPTFKTSTNWAGYVVPSSSDLVTVADGNWRVPTLDCSTVTDGGASAWVGIGGYPWPTGGKSGALLQTGVTTDCVGGMQENRGWWELYPSVPNYAAHFSGFTVSAGDAIEASVYQTSTGGWETRVDDLTTGISGVMITGEGWGVFADNSDGRFPLQGRTTNMTYAGGYTAEWIVEAYTQDEAQVTLADFGTIAFTNLRTSLASWTLTADDGIAMRSKTGSGIVATPSLPQGDGFSVSYTG